MPWADCNMGTSELIGEDPSAVIRLDASQQWNRLDVAAWEILYCICLHFVVNTLLGNCCLLCVLYPCPFHSL